ncbi:MAG: sulfotransferase [Deltaproteobacteria bacterium]|nr:sulfotransferase [Deltaproteobacteria bacterium]
MDLTSGKGLGRKIIRAGLTLTSRIFSGFEGLAFGNAGPALPPVFIIGLPRGGTTLVYQVVCHSFQVAYTPMLSNSLVFAPSLAAWLSRRRSSQYSSDFYSDYGMSAGLASPGEGGMWNLWFNKDQSYTRLDKIESWKAREVVRLVGRVERIGQGPFLNKNLRHNNRLRVLAGLLPNAVFLVVLRDPGDTAVSLLQGRIRKEGGPASWYSVKPRSYDRLKNLEPERAVVFQVRDLALDLREDMETIGLDRFAAIDYQEFCADPAAALDRLVEFLEGHGLSLQITQAPPSSFEVSKNRTGRLTSEQARAIDTTISDLFADSPMIDMPCQWLTGRSLARV